MKMQGRLIVIMAIAALYSVASYAASTASNTVTANGVTVTTLTGPAAAAATKAAQANSTTTTSASATPAPAASSAAPLIPEPATSLPSTATATVATPAPAVTATPAQAQAAPVAPIAAATTVTATTIAAPAPTPAMQEQPTTVIESTPLTTSNADDLRKVEEQTEVQTEQKIAEKLEQERIAAEKQRQQEILNSMNAMTPATPAAQPAQPATPAPAPQPSVIVVSPAQNQQPSKEQIQDMVKADLSDMKPKPQAGHYFMSGSVGQINYNSSSVSSFGAASLSFGKEFPSNWDISGDFGYSNNDVNQDYYMFQKMNQYSLGVTARYVFFKGMIRPSLGGAVDYVRRQYSSLENGFYSTGSLDQQTSDAVDAGVVAAIDLAVSDSLQVGLEYRYMMNVGYQYENEDWMNSESYRSYLQNIGVTPLEQQGYSLTSLVIRYLF